MAYSSRLKSLERRIVALRKAFLPAQFSPQGLYSDQVLDNARAFRVLVHAEIEHYIEDRALEIASGAFDLYAKKSRATHPLVCLLTNAQGEQPGLPKKLGTKLTALTAVGKLLGQYRYTLTHNHGIRTHNLLQILLPIGILESEIDVVWLSTTDAFGLKRGETAHSSSISSQIDPRDDYQTVQQVMAGLKDLDLLLNALKRKLR